MNVLIAPDQIEKLLQVTLPRPSDNSPQQFLYDENNIALYEVTKYHDQFRSWFLDNMFCRDGHMNILTRIDPLFIFLPQLIKLAEKQYRTLHDICLTFSSDAPANIDKIDYALSPNINWGHVCDTKEIDDELYMKFSQEKTLEWLLNKHKKAFKAFETELGEHSSKATLISYATDMISQYLPASLIDKFKTEVDRMKYNLANPNEPESKKAGAPRPSNSAKRPAEHFGDSINKLNKQTSSTPQAKVIPKGSVMNFFKPKK